MNFDFPFSSARERKGRVVIEVEIRAGSQILYVERAMQALAILRDARVEGVFNGQRICVEPLGRLGACVHQHSDGRPERDHDGWDGIK